jgi:hypothetical protein
VTPYDIVPAAVAVSVMIEKTEFESVVETASAVVSVAVPLTGVAELRAIANLAAFDVPDA